MAKKTKEELQSEEDERTKETLAAMAGVGEVDAELSASSNEVDAFESMPTVTPGKPGFDDGKTLAGTFVRTKRVENENSSAAKVDPVTGRKMRNLHIFADKRGTKFGIWGVGSLDAAMRCMKEGAYIEITNDGLAAEPLKPGQNPPRNFSYKGRNADGSRLVFDWDQDESARSTQNSAAPQARQ